MLCQIDFLCLKTDLRIKSYTLDGSHCSVNHVSGGRGHLDPNLKVIVLRNEFELKYLFE